MSTVNAATSQTDPSHGRVTPGVEKAAEVRDGARCHAHLSESSDGWLLTLTLSPAALDQLRTARQVGDLKLTPGQVSISITPNLVPGKPFDLSALRLVLDDASTGSGDETDRLAEQDDRGHG